ncbi:MAG: nucleotide exchange factor GrpE [Deltaproteobacteria bacterium]|nr:nucleotide exchange factor GrpE [Deltaproteobacteria bacterium]PWB67419.1 MAG: nucleotide exchange factor GrpE [Deltaproteobacteria bacterium]
MDDNDKNSKREAPAGDPGPVGQEGAEPQPPSAEEVAGELEEMKKRLAYLAAEFDNYRKRVAREKEAVVSYGNERLLRAILPFLDNLERAMAQAGAESASEGLLAGVRLTHDQLLSELGKFGLEPVSAEGERFDPNLHEAIAQVPWEGKPEGTVLSVAVKGYLLNGRLLRPAQVTVAAAPACPIPDRGDGADPDPTGRGN